MFRRSRMTILCHAMSGIGGLQYWRNCSRMNDFTTEFTWMIKYFSYSVDNLNKQESENGNTKKLVVKILKVSRLTLTYRTYS